MRCRNRRKTHECDDGMHVRKHASVIFANLICAVVRLRFGEGDEDLFERRLRQREIDETQPRARRLEMR